MVDFPVSRGQFQFSVAIPPRRGAHGAYSTASRLFPQMEVGASFAIPSEWRKRLVSAASVYKRANPGWNFTTRTIDSEVRLWRTA